MTLRGGPNNGEQVMVVDDAKVFYALLRQGNEFLRVQGVYAAGVAGSGNFYWQGVE